MEAGGCAARGSSRWCMWRRCGVARRRVRRRRRRAARMLVDGRQGAWRARAGCRARRGRSQPRMHEDAARNAGGTRAAGVRLEALPPRWGIGTQPDQPLCMRARRVGERGPTPHPPAAHTGAGWTPPSGPAGGNPCRRAFQSPQRWGWVRGGRRGAGVRASERSSPPPHRPPPPPLHTHTPLQVRDGARGKGRLGCVGIGAAPWRGGAAGCGGGAGWGGHAGARGARAATAPCLAPTRVPCCAWAVVRMRGGTAAVTRPSHRDCDFTMGTGSAHRARMPMPATRKGPVVQRGDDPRRHWPHNCDTARVRARRQPC